MSLDASRLNSARYSSALADIQAQFPINGGLLPAEQSSLDNFQQKLAHAIADHEGTDVVSEITGHAIVNQPIHVSITAGPGAGSTGATDATGTVS